MDPVSFCGERRRRRFHDRRKEEDVQEKCLRVVLGLLLVLGSREGRQTPGGRCLETSSYFILSGVSFSGEQSGSDQAEDEDSL